jgi:hypothetical protein
MTQQLLLNLSEQLYQQLLTEAEQKGETVENLALKYLKEVLIKSEDDPLSSFIGAFNSQSSDWLENHDLYLGKSSLESTNDQSS